MENTKQSLCLLLALVMFSTLSVAPTMGQLKEENKKRPDVTQPLQNGSFEEGSVDDRPAGWISPAIKGYRIVISDKQPKEGKQSALIHRDSKPEPGQFGNLSQGLDATMLRGKRVRFRAAVRTEVVGDGNQAQLWFRVDRVASEGAKSVGAFDNMANRPIKAEKWSHYEIVGDVAEDAERLIVGLLLLGKGKAWIDEASLEVVGKDVEVTAKTETASLIERSGPGLFEISGSMRLTPNTAFLRARRAEYEKGDRWKESPIIVLIPLPLAYRSQVPLSYEVSIHPPKAGDSIKIYNDQPENYVAKVVLADVLNREQIDVSFRSAVLVGPTLFDSVPRTAAVPETWPENVQPWLKATWCVDAEHDRVREIAKEIRDDTDDVMQIISLVEQRAKKIFGAAEGHVRNLTAVEALDKRGSCTSCGNLVAALLRASGVPARVLSGYPSWSGPLQTHYIVEAYVPRHGWYPIESTMCRSPWPNFQQVNVAIIPVEYEGERRARARSFAAGGVPYLSLTEIPNNPGIVLFRGMIDEGRNCDHVCKLLRKVEASPGDWEDAMQGNRKRWKQWLVADHKLSDGTLSFSKTADKISAKSLAELISELRQE